MKNRVVVTGLGVCAPNGVGLGTFRESLVQAKSGITHYEDLQKLKFSCQVAGKPNINTVNLNEYFSKVQLRGLDSSGLIYGVLAGVDAWKDAQLVKSNDTNPDWDSGIVFGTGILGVDKFRDSIYKLDKGDVRRLGSTSVIQTMASGISAYLGGILGLGNQVTTNSSACTTGTEAILMGFERIQSGKAKRMLVGSCSDSGPYVWGGFDAMRILPRKFNETPDKASRPMSATAAGFVPGSGAGALVLESLESALARGVKIYAEVLGGAINSGGQRAGGSMTAPNNAAVQRCIQEAIANAGIDAEAIDAINGHLTATTKDTTEIENWCQALNRRGDEFPYVNSFKSHFGHCLAAAGSIESVAAVLQLEQHQLFANLNCEDVHPDILKLVSNDKIPRETLNFPAKIIAKASFGFGDVNACLILSKYQDSL
ncbi:beta-ketoacyl-[acyl-carrier-protein] synthase family protein [Croceitalea rosinachiae]|uniref:3-oxoacyl-[acyl-carrier-protein] synthase 1 n=1 Tax=Croceitalea rosinachiae TaxID=3075596 RepID=A0ABU3ABT0_9FLAO|nr:beta-ketoacyl-[acyl-carrier-protein] synthase family protein [Croceitalea sp. F388]MDT0607630.1 beta-ketoacyl-[acyl-carrier-protein] synthase family protein [Croceitalea sp. F388]